MKITIVSGSHRNPSQTEKVARHIEKVLGEKFDNAEPHVFTLADNPLPLWDQSIWDGSEEWAERLKPYKQQLSESDAFVVVAPEWHGQVPAGLKNFFLLFNRFELGHKPALIVTVSNGTGGAYPVAELRMSSYKNNRICYIPEQVIIRDVEHVLNDSPEDNNQDADPYFRERIEWCMGLLIAYGDALKTVRETAQIHNDKFSNGM